MSAAKAGRNDPCPCGSGNKYKRCCLAKDEAARLAAQNAPATAPVAVPDVPRPKVERAPVPAPEPTEAELAWEVLWERFERASLDERLAIVHETIDAGALDDEGAFELCCPLIDALMTAERFADVRSVIERIEREAGAAYAANAGWFALWSAEATVRANAGGEVDAVRRLGEQFHRVVHSGQQFLEYLRFHGRGDLLEALLAAAWPTVRDSDDLLDWAKASIGDLYVETLIARHRAQRPNVAADDAALIADLRPILGRDHDIEDAIRPWLARTTRTWTGTSFDAAEDFRDLLIQFSAVLMARSGFSALRAGMVRESLWRWARQTPDSKRERGGGRSKRAQPTIFAAPRSVSALTDGHGVRSVVHSLAAALLALPHWRDFLVEQGLAERAAAESAFRAFLGQARQELEDSLIRDLERRNERVAAAQVLALFAATGTGPP